MTAPSVVWGWKSGTTYVMLLLWYHMTHYRYSYVNMGFQLQLTYVAVITCWLHYLTFLEPVSGLMHISCIIFLYHSIIVWESSIIPWYCRAVCRPMMGYMESFITNLLNCLESISFIHCLEKCKSVYYQICWSPCHISYDSILFERDHDFQRSNIITFSANIGTGIAWWTTPSILPYFVLQ